MLSFVVEKKIVYEGSTIFYRTTGSGKTVLLIHGFPADASLWDKQVAFLEDHCKLIIPDLPGSGRSDLVPNANIETYAEIIKGVLDKESEDSISGPANGATIIGHSMGGYITLAFAEKYGGQLDSFLLFHSTAFADNEEKKQARTKAIDDIREKGSEAFLQKMVPGLFTGAFAEKHADQIEALTERAKKLAPDALIQYYEAMKNRPDRIAVLKSFSNPIVFIVGEYDTAITLQSSLQQCYLPARSQVHILDQSAHMGMWEEKDKVNRILLDFLNNQF